MVGEGEEWREVPGTEGVHASTHGRVRDRDGVILGQRKKRADGDAGKFHLFVRFDLGGSVREEKVHKLVLDAFVGPRPAECCGCRHLDGDTLNNRLGNLAWWTAAQFAAVSPRSVLRDRLVERAKQMRAGGVGCDEIGRVLGVTADYVSKLTRGKARNRAKSD